MDEKVEQHIQARYELKERLGKGAYGIVWRAEDKETGEVVAVKKIFDAFQNVTDAQRTFREIGYLQAFSEHPNIITLLNVIAADNDKDIYLVFEHMDTDLHRARKLLKQVHMPYIAYQIVKALYYMHSGGVLHRDLKPANVLVNDECFCKLADFGLARSIGIGHDEEIRDDDAASGPLTNYLGTRWYRSPELLLGSERYSGGSDMWSVGCIIGELISGDPLFRGDSQYNMVELIIGTVGRPSPTDVEACHIASFVDLDKVKVKGKRSLQSRFADAGPDALDLLTKLLAFNPQKRITAAAALAHPYFKRFREKDTEIALSYSVRVAVDDTKRLSIKDYRIRLYSEIQENLARVEAAREARTSAVAAASAGSLPGAAVVAASQRSSRTVAAASQRSSRTVAAASQRSSRTTAHRGSSRRDPVSSAWEAETLDSRSSAQIESSYRSIDPYSDDLGDDDADEGTDEVEEDEDPDIAALKALSIREPSSRPSTAKSKVHTPRSAAAQNRKHSMREPQMPAVRGQTGSAPSKSRVSSQAAGPARADSGGGGGAVRREVKSAKEKTAAERIAAARQDEPMMDVFGRKVGGKKKVTGGSQHNSSNIFGSPMVRTPQAGVRRPSADWRKSPEDIHRHTEVAAPLMSVYGQSSAKSSHAHTVVRPSVQAASAGLPWGPRTSTQPW